MGIRHLLTQEGGVDFQEGSVRYFAHILVARKGEDWIVKALPSLIAVWVFKTRACDLSSMRRKPLCVIPPLP